MPPPPLNETLIAMKLFHVLGVFFSFADYEPKLDTQRRPNLINGNNSGAHLSHPISHSSVRHQEICKHTVLDKTMTV